VQKSGAKGSALRPFDAVAIDRHRPEARVQEGFYERAETARKRP
jgi:hypothetical protein